MAARGVWAMSLLHPGFARNGLVYLSWIEAGQGDTRGAVVGRGRLVRQGAPRLENVQVIWRQAPKVEGRGHYGHRLAFGPDGKLYISNGDRQKFEPAQDMSGTLGKVVRINDDGTVPTDNPWAKRGGATAQLWTPATATFSASLSHPTGSCGATKWARRTAMSSTSSRKARTTDIRSFPTAIIMTASRFRTTTPGRS
jgi:glucose/arabinose dehydrogenase